MSSEHDIRQPSQMSGSIKESQLKSSKEATEEQVDVGPPYTPMIPQMWQPKLIEFSEVQIIKYKRIF